MPPDGNLIKRVTVGEFNFSDKGIQDNRRIKKKAPQPSQNLRLISSLAFKLLFKK